MNAVDYVATPIGTITIRASKQGLTHLVFAEAEAQASPNKILRECKRQLKEYFAGTRQEFDLPLDPQGTDFQRSIWDYLQTIPFGETLAYSDIAEMANNPKGVRAVGAANGKNPISIIVPCHRVIGKNGTLTGYAGGLKRKKWLLAHEGIESFALTP